MGKTSVFLFLRICVAICPRRLREFKTTGSCLNLRELIVTQYNIRSRDSQTNICRMATCKAIMSTENDDVVRLLSVRGKGSGWVIL